MNPERDFLPGFKNYGEFRSALNDADEADEIAKKHESTDIERPWETPDPDADDDTEDDDSQEQDDD